MKKENNIEKINEKRIEIYNSNEYKIGSMIVKMKNLLKKLQILKLFKLIVRHNKIEKLSLQNTNEYGIIKKNNDNFLQKKIVVYTCITGNYDNIIEPLFISNNIDYIMFTDNKEKITSSWQIKNLCGYKELKKMNQIEKNRFIKMNPGFFFEKKYDYSIYIDGNIEVVSDIRKLINCVNYDYGIAMHKHRNRNDIYKEFEVCKLLRKGNIQQMSKQIVSYKKNGFPKNYGMLEANVIVVDLNNKKAKLIMKQWWDEFRKSKSERDQISLIYILWKNKISVNNIATLGSDVYKNSIFYIESHK